MRLLFDQNLSFKLCRRVADIFPGSAQVRLVGLAEADDQAVWGYAKQNGFILVSQDSDFAEMAALLGPPPQVTWPRRGNQSTAAIEDTLRRHAEAIADLAKRPDAACLEIY